MASKANVHSISAIEDVRNTLCRFGEDARIALGGVEMEIRRTVGWLQNDRFPYWQAQVKRRNQEVSEARAALHRKRLMGGSDHTAHVGEEKEKLREAMTRLHEAEAKVELVRKWGPMLQQAIAEYESHARPLGDMVQGDLVRGVAKLDRMLDALDAYIHLAPPPTIAEPEAAGTTREATSSVSSGTPATAGASEATVTAEENGATGEPAASESSRRPSRRRSRARRRGSLSPRR